MDKIMLFAVSACVSSLLPGLSHAGEFVNRNLQSQQMPFAQYDAIRKGAVAECVPRAAAVAKRGSNAPANCDAYKQAYGDWNPMAYMQCQQAIDANQVDEKAFVDVLVGCMAGKGWIFE